MISKLRLRKIWEGYWEIVFVTALAGVLRFGFLDSAHYYVDQANVTYQALLILEKGQWPTTGLKASGFLNLPHPPLMAYIQALPLLVSRSPMAVVSFTTFLNLLAVPLTYLLGLRLFDRLTAIAASFFYAISPWAVEFTRTAWEPGLMPFFTALITYLLFPALTEDRGQGKRIFAALATLALMAQTYLLAYVAVLQMVSLFLVFRRRLSWQPLLAGLVFFVLISGPYLLTTLYEPAVTPGDHLEGFLTGPWKLDNSALQAALHLIMGTFTNNIAAEIARWGLTLMLLVGIGEGVLRLLKKERADTYLILFLWFFTPIALMSVHSSPISSRYLLTTLPAGFLLAGRGVRRLWWGYLRGAVAIVAVGLALIFGVDLYGRYQVGAELLKGGGIGVPTLGYSRSLGQVVRGASGEVYIEGLPLQAQSWFSAMSGMLVEPYTEFEPEGFVVLRANHPALYVLLDSKEFSPGFTFAQELVDKGIDLPSYGSIRFFLFPPRSKEEFAQLPSHPLNLKFDIGWRLLGYDLPQIASPGQTINFTTYWLVEELPPDPATLYFKPFVHLLDENGQRVADEDGRGQAGYLWREGDLFIDTSRLLLPSDLPSGDYWIYTGLYNPNTSPCCTRALLTNGEDYILLGPVSNRPTDRDYQ